MDLDVILLLIVLLPLQPPHQLHVKGPDLASVNPAEVETHLQVVVRLASCRQCPLIIQKLEVFGLLLTNIGNVLQFPAQFCMYLGIDLFGRDGLPQRLAQSMDRARFP